MTIVEDRTRHTPQADAEGWLKAFEAALQSRDAAAAAGLFLADGLWRDVLAFTWNIQTMAGRPTIEATLRQTIARTKPANFHIPPRRDMEIRRLRAGNRLAQRRLDRRPAGHGLDVPGEGQHVAPEPVGQEQPRRRRRIARLQGRFEGLKPALGVGLRRMTCAILDYCHRETRELRLSVASSGGILLQRCNAHHVSAGSRPRSKKNAGAKPAYFCTVHGILR